MNKKMTSNEMVKWLPCIGVAVILVVVILHVVNYGGALRFSNDVDHFVMIPTRVDMTSLEAFVHTLGESLIQHALPIHPLVYALQNIEDKDGIMLEFGVYSGSSIQTIASYSPNATIVGFDSFEGLPETWRAGYEQGVFNLDRNMPDVFPPNVAIYRGWFDSTIPRFKKILKDERISLLHIDCDLYSSTKLVLDAFHENIRDGTWVVFDELVGYDGFEEHEIKALYEFLIAYQKEIQVVGRLLDEGNTESAVIRVL